MTRLIERTGKWGVMIRVLSMLESGMFVLGYADLERIPYTMILCWMIFRDVKKEIAREQQNR